MCVWEREREREGECVFKCVVLNRFLMCKRLWHIRWAGVTTATVEWMGGFNTWRRVDSHVCVCVWDEQESDKAINQPHSHWQGSQMPGIWAKEQEKNRAVVCKEGKYILHVCICCYITHFYFWFWFGKNASKKTWYELSMTDLTTAACRPMPYANVWG